MPSFLPGFQPVNRRLVDNFVLILLAAIGSTAIPIFAGVFRLFRLKTEMALLLCLLTLMLNFELYSLSLYLNGKNPYWLQHVYSPIEYIFVIVIFSFWIDNARFRKMLFISIPVFILLAVVTVMTFESLDISNGFMASISCIAYIVVSLLVIHNIFTTKNGLVYKNYKFWVSAGFLLYSSGSILYFSFYDFLASYHLWLFHNICNVLANIIFTIGFLCLPRR